MYGVCLILAPHELIRPKRPQPEVARHNPRHEQMPDQPHVPHACEQYQRIGIGHFTFEQSNGWESWLNESVEQDIVLR